MELYDQDLLREDKRLAKRGEDLWKRGQTVCQKKVRWWLVNLQWV